MGKNQVKSCMHACIHSLIPWFKYFLHSFYLASQAWWHEMTILALPLREHLLGHRRYHEYLEGVWDTPLHPTFLSPHFRQQGGASKFTVHSPEQKCNWFQKRYLRHIAKKKKKVLERDFRISKSWFSHQKPTQEISECRISVIRHRVGRNAQQ